MDVARATYLDLTGQPVLTGAPRDGRTWVVENFDLVSSLTYRRDDKLSIMDWLRSYRGVEEASWFAWDDLAPFMMMGWRSLQWASGRIFPKASKPQIQAEVSGTRPQ